MGIFLMISSLHKNGMDEPVIVGTKGFDAESAVILPQPGDVRLVPFDDFRRSLTCCKARTMLQFTSQPKAWREWAPSAIRHFDRYVGVVGFAQSQGWRIPGPIPACLKREIRRLCTLVWYPVSIHYRIMKRWWKWFV